MAAKPVTAQRLPIGGTMTHSRLARIAGFLLIFFAASCAGGRGWAESPTVGAATEAGTDLATGFQEH
jgi:hypothetical protein